MRCIRCDNEIADGAKYCTLCGADQTKQSDRSDIRSSVPTRKFPTNRRLAKLILLSLVTLGVYAILVYTQMSSEINVLASRADGKRTVPYLLMLVLSYLSLGIYAYIWEHQFASRIHAELIRRECDVSFDASDFWLWGVLGTFIFVGPFVYRHKQLNAMNCINAHYNEYGNL